MRKKIGELIPTVQQETDNIDSHRGNLFTSVTSDGRAQVDMDKLRQFNIFFATPCYGGLVTDQYFLSMFRLNQYLMQAGIPHQITTLRNESLVPRARNTIAAMFMASNATHLFWIDADIEFDPESVIRALAMDRDILAGAYPKKTLPIQYAINLKFADPSKGQVRMENGAIELHDASTGFFCVKRRVFDQMRAAYPELKYNNDSQLDPKFADYTYAFYDTFIDPIDRRYLSEDYYFCRLWQKLGGTIWLDPNTNLNHVGSYTFQGQIQNLFKTSGQPENPDSSVPAPVVPVEIPLNPDLTELMKANA